LHQGQPILIPSSAAISTTVTKSFQEALLELASCFIHYAETAFKMCLHPSGAPTKIALSVYSTHENSRMAELIFTKCDT
jgi:hypothetical protein